MKKGNVGRQKFRKVSILSAYLGLIPTVRRSKSAIAHPQNKAYGEAVLRVLRLSSLAFYGFNDCS